MSSTGWPEIDKKINQGMPRGEIVVFMAGKASGKSMIEPKIDEPKEQKVESK